MIIPQWFQEQVIISQNSETTYSQLEVPKEPDVEGPKGPDGPFTSNIFMSNNSKSFGFFSTDNPLVTLTEHFNENDIKNEWEKLFKNIKNSIKTEVVDSYEVEVEDNFNGDTVPSKIVDICERYNINPVNVESVRVERYTSDPFLYKIVIKKRFF